MRFHELKRFDDAVASYDRALAIKRTTRKHSATVAMRLQDLRRFDDAVASYDRALAIRPDYVEALYNRGIALREQKRFDDAVASYDRALKIAPGHAETLHRERGHGLRCSVRHGPVRFLEHDHSWQPHRRNAFARGARCHDYRALRHSPA